MSPVKDPNVSTTWNGVIWTAHASKGARFGTGTGASEEEAVKAAVKDLEKDPERTAPEVGGAHSTAAHGADPEKVATVRAGKTGG